MAVRTYLGLDDLVTSVATDLMGVTADDLVSSVTPVLRQLVDFFDMDLAFLRRNDHAARATILIAEWPARAEVVDPDPLGIVDFAVADPVFAALEHLKTPLFVRPGGSDDEYQQRIREGSGVAGVSLASVPLLRGGLTIGTLGFIKYGDREWSTAETNALKAVASLLAQLQSRITAEERLRFLADHDELTGLINRRALTRALEERVAAGQSDPVVVLFADVDRLKALNSFLGNAAGDQFLQVVANRLREWSAGRHLLCRLGGDEFVVALAPGVTSGEGLELARHLRDIIRRPIPLGGDEISRAISVGLTAGLPGACEVPQLLEEADQAMRLAKVTGGDDVVVFTEEMRLRNEFRTDIELHLATAVAGGALSLDYQPEVDISDGRILGVEGLVRWQHPQLGRLLPADFLDVAHSSNLGGEIGRWVLREGCQQLRRWHDDLGRSDLGMSLNVSPAQLISSDFADTVSEVLRDAGLAGRHLTLEITEHAVIRDVGQAVATVRALRSIGVGVAIDDFGVGYSSFAELKALPVSKLKIDRGFVTNLGSDPDDFGIVSAMVGLARSFDLDLVAEGVETMAAVDVLLELGCTRAQGYLFSRPLAACDIEPTLRAGRIEIPRGARVAEH